MPSVVQPEWGLSATAAGSISSGFQFGTAGALVVVSALADYLDPRALFIGGSGRRDPGVAADSERATVETCPRAG